MSAYPVNSRLPRSGSTLLAADRQDKKIIAHAPASSFPGNTST